MERTYKCGVCGKDIGNIEVTITKPGTYTTEYGMVEVAIDDLKATVVDGSGRCEDHEDGWMQYD